MILPEGGVVVPNSFCSRNGVVVVPLPLSMRNIFNRVGQHS